MNPLDDIPRGTEVLLHICCAPDAAYGVRSLRDRFDVAGFFYNPNIHPREEFRKRLLSTLDLQEKVPFPLLVGSGGGGGGVGGKREESGGTRDGGVRDGADRQPEKGRRDGEPRGTRGRRAYRRPLCRGGPEKGERNPGKRPHQQGAGALPPAVLRVQVLFPIGKGLA